MRGMIFGVLLARLVCFPIFGQNINDFEIKIETAGSNQAITITGYKGTAKDIRIPERIDGILVTEIGTEAFADKMLTSVIFPASIKSIGQYAFNNNKLTNLDLSSLDVFIGGWAFANNLLTNLTLPQNKTMLDSYVFYKNKLTGIILPNNIEYIGKETFSGNQITRIKIGSNVKLGDEENGWYSFTTVEFDNERNRFYHVESNPFDRFYIGSR
jgi:hypothetical protein